jgi:hypothetical protein
MASLTTRLSLRPLLLAASAVLVATGISGGGPAAAGGTAAPPAAGVIQPVRTCSSLASVDLTGVDARVEKAAEVDRNGRNFCDVTGYMSPQTHFQVLLPLSTWRGNYLQQGCGGLCGSSVVNLDDPSRTSGYQVPFRPVSDGEMVIAADDEGHAGGGGLWGKDDPQLRVVFGYTSEHSMAVTAKRLIGEFYGRGPAYSYFDGVSDGGRMALFLAQRYPADFNGIIAGAPANNWAALIGLLETWQARANMTPAGDPILTAEKIPALHDAVMKRCADRNGVIRDPRRCDFNPATVRCPSGVNRDDCLTAREVRVVRDLYRGPRDARGRHLYDGGQPYGSELAWKGWLLPERGDTAWPANTFGPGLGLEYLRYLAFWRNPPAGFDLRDVRYTKKMHDRLQRVGGIYNATNPDLEAFRNRGGKLIIYHGWADEAIPPFGTVNYYRAVSRSMGGTAATESFSRLYMVPGLYHCPCFQPHDGDPATAVQFLPELTAWVEEGRAPGTVTLPVTFKTTGEPLPALTVSPFNPSAPDPAPTGLNSRYHYVGLPTVYRPSNQLWCQQRGRTMVCRSGERP